MRELTNRSLHL